MTRKGGEREREEARGEEESGNGSECAHAQAGKAHYVAIKRGNLLSSEGHAHAHAVWHEHASDISMIFQ